MDMICDADVSPTKLILLIVYMGLEAWLGKTEKVKSNSLLHLLWTIALAAYWRVKNKGAKDDKAV